MNQVTVSISNELIEELSSSFFQGPMLDENGRRDLYEVELDRMNNMSIQIQANEHAPPHFHVRSGGENASFSIADGVRLKGIKGLEKFDKNIKQWWKKNYCTLIEVWNQTRPSDCPVGLVDVPPECVSNEVTSDDQ